DVIESVGVLHHMADPIAGWKVLVDCLKPGGLMKIGLYSELAWRAVNEVQAIVSAMGLRATIEDIRKFRSFAFDQDGENRLKDRVANLLDFYSVSTCRDLYFHTQVHCYTFLQVKDALDALGLTFIGVETFPEVMKAFKQDPPDPPEAYSLDAWHAFETAHPES